MHPGGLFAKISPTCSKQKALSQDRTVVTGPLMTVDNTFTETDEEALQLLLDTQFPDCAFDNGNKLEPKRDEENEPLEGAKNVLSEAKVLQSSKMFCPYKSPGVDGILPAHLQNGADLLVPHLLKLYMACLRFGYIPENWR